MEIGKLHCNLAIAILLIFSGQAYSQISVTNINGLTQIKLDGQLVDLSQPHAVRYEDNQIQIISPEAWPEAKITVGKPAGNIISVEYKGSFFKIMSPEEAEMHVQQQMQHISSSMAILQEQMKNMYERFTHMFGWM